MSVTSSHVDASFMDVREAALAYADLGFSVLACEGKKPAVNWSAFQSRPAHPDTIRKWDEVGLLQNVGIICGRVSGNLVVIDLDGWDAVEAYVQQFPRLAQTYIVTSGGGNGQHFYYYVKDLPPTTRAMGTDIGNVELRADGCYVVAPPSIHPVSQQPYTVLRPLPIMMLPDMREVVTWIKGLIDQKFNVPTPAAKLRPVKTGSRWANAALDAECRAVQFAPSSSRNNTLNRAAFKLGQLVNRQLLDRRDVECRLEIAAADLAKSDGVSTVIKTIKSGLDAGIANPRRV